ncbi:unnamed protein product [Bursaphelenchus xylophilus]|nr:unnamed protein product [Bursaphelenchus xylophilus]CAG9097369.1 unnamed protein product [Bursaphelenchus xylophilus]
MRPLNVYYPPFFPAVDHSECREFPTLHPTVNCMYPGFMVEILNHLVRDMNLTLVSALSSEFRRDLFRKPLIDKEGKPHGEFLLLYNGTIDIIASPFQPTEGRKRWFTFSHPMYQTDTSIIIGKNLGLSSSMWSFFRTYSSNTWLAILVALVVQIMVCTCIRYFEASFTKQKPITVVESGWQMLRLQLMQPEKIYFKSIAGRLSILLFSLVQCAVLLGVFSTWILSSIITESIENPIDRLGLILRQIRDGKKTMIASRYETWFYEKIYNSDENLFKEFRWALEKNPLQKVETIDETLAHISSGNYISFAQDDEDTKYTTLKYCNILEITTGMPTVSSHLLFRKDFELIDQFNQAIFENQAHILRIVKKYKNLSKKKTQRFCSPSVGPAPLRIIPYSGLLIVCFIIIIVALVILIVENYTRMVQKRHEGKCFRYPKLLKVAKFIF